MERTSAHEFGHSATLTHPPIGTMPGNLMNQTAQPDAGMKITPEHLQQIRDAYYSGQLNHGRQY